MALTNEEWEKINQATREIHMPAKDERTARKNILGVIRSLIYFDFGDFCYAVHEDNTMDTVITDPVSISRYPREFQLEYEYAYQNQYGAMDYTKWCLNSAESIAFLENDIIDSEARLKTKFYKEFLKPRGLIYSMGCYIINEAHISVPSAIALYRDENQSDFSSKDLEILKTLLPHIEVRMAGLASDNTPVEIDPVDLYIMNKYGLTRRECAVTRQIMLGFSNIEIAEHLNISVYTVKKHISHILQKTQVSGRLKLIQLLKM